MAGGSVHGVSATHVGGSGVGGDGLGGARLHECTCQHNAMRNRRQKRPPDDDKSDERQYGDVKLDERQYGRANVWNSYTDCVCINNRL